MIPALFHPKRGLFPVEQYWKGTMLERIPQDLRFVIDLICRSDGPAIKPKYQETSQWIHGGSPQGLALCKAGNLFIADALCDMIQVYQPDGTYIRAIGGQGSKPGQFQRPQGLAFDLDWRLLVTDQENHRLQVFNVDGPATFLFLIGGEQGEADGQLSLPDAVAVDNEGNYLITQPHKLQVFTPSGQFLRKIADQDFYPTGLAVNAQGHLIVVERKNNVVRIFDALGELLRVIGKPDPAAEGTIQDLGEFMNPNAVVLDKAGNLIVTDTSNCRVAILTPEGKFLMQLEDLNFPSCSVIDREGNIIVADDYRSQIVLFG